MGSRSRKQFFDSLFSKEALRKLFPHRDAALQAYLRRVGTLAPLLTAEEEARLLPRAIAGDQQAQRRLVEANLKMVILIATRFQGQGLSIMDLIQEGNLGLYDAMAKFDLSKGTRFTTYAKFHVVKRLGRAIAVRAKHLSMPYSTAQRVQQIEQAISALLERGAEPTPEKIAQHVGLLVEQVTELLDFIQEPLSFSQKTGEHDALIERLADPPLILSNEASEAISPSLLAEITTVIDTALTKDERLVITHLFGLNEQGIVYDYHEIAARCYGRSGPRVDVRIRQIEQSALKKLRAAFENA